MKRYLVLFIIGTCYLFSDGYVYGDIDSFGSIDMYDENGNYYYGDVDSYGNIDMYDGDGNYLSSFTTLWSPSSRSKSDSLAA